MDSLSVQKGYQIIVLIGAEDSAILTCKSSDRWPQRRLVAFWPQNWTALALCTATGFVAKDPTKRFEHKGRRALVNFSKVDSSEVAPTFKDMTTQFRVTYSSVLQTNVSIARFKIVGGTVMLTTWKQSMRRHENNHLNMYGQERRKIAGGKDPLWDAILKAYPRSMHENQSSATGRGRASCGRRRHSTIPPINSCSNSRLRRGLAIKEPRVKQI